MATILITGGSGMIGTAITRALVQKGHQVIILTRDPSKMKAVPGISYAAWDPVKMEIGREAIGSSDAIINLAGANVAGKRWTAKRKKEILDSRVNGSRLIVQALGTLPNKVTTVVSAAAIGYYGPDPSIPNNNPFKEDDPPSSDFLATVVQQWEAAISPVTQLGKRLVILRTGIVLSKEGGAYPEFAKTLKLRVAAVPGSGRQVVSWIHIDDLVNMYIEAVFNDSWKGVFNAVAPQSVTNKDLVRSIASHQVKIPLPSTCLNG
jgi:uncharacterized protein (TIGR01777 family)